MNFDNILIRLKAVRCPECGGKLNKKYYCKSSIGAVLVRDRIPLYVPKNTIISKFTAFECVDCGRTYSPEELLKNKKE